MIRKALLILTVLVLLSGAIFAQQSTCETNISQALILLEQANTAFSNDDIVTAQSLVSGAQALLNSCQEESDCPALAQAITILGQVNSTSDIATASALTDAAIALLNSCAVQPEAEDTEAEGSSSNSPGQQLIIPENGIPIAHPTAIEESDHVQDPTETPEPEIILPQDFANDQVQFKYPVGWEAHVFEAEDATIQITNSPELWRSYVIDGPNTLFEMDIPRGSAFLSVLIDIRLVDPNITYPLSIDKLIDAGFTNYNFSEVEMNALDGSQRTLVYSEVEDVEYQILFFEVGSKIAYGVLFTDEQDHAEYTFVPHVTMLIASLTIPDDEAPEIARIGDDNILFFDTFDDNRNNWETADTGEIFSDIVDGKYIIDHAVDNRGWWVMPGWEDYSLAPIMDSPYEAEFQFQILENRTENPRIGFAYNIEEGYSSGFWIGVRTDGSWRRRNWDGEIEGEGFAGNLTISDGQVYTLRLRVTQRDIQLYLEDRLIATVQNQDGIHGTVGFGMTNGRTGSVRIAYDNFTIRSLPDDTPETTGDGIPVAVFQNSQIRFNYPQGWYPHVYEGCECIYITNNDQFYEYLKDNVRQDEWLWEDVDPGTVFIQILDDVEIIDLDVPMPLSLDSLRQGLGTSEVYGDVIQVSAVGGGTRTVITLDRAPTPDMAITFFEMDGRVANAMIMIDETEKNDYQEEVALILGSITMENLDTSSSTSGSSDRTRIASIVTDFYDWYIDRVEAMFSGGDALPQDWYQSESDLFTPRFISELIRYYNQPPQQITHDPFVCGNDLPAGIEVIDVQTQMSGALVTVIRVDPNGTQYGDPFEVELLVTTASRYKIDDINCDG